MRTYPAFATACLLAGLAACQTPATTPDAPQIPVFGAEAPSWAAEGTCWGKDTSPAVVETITEQVEIQPAEIADDGTVLRPAVFETQTRQAIVQERQDTWFETPCPDLLTPEFIATLQRALLARGLYRGEINGQLDWRTQTAIRRYQRPGGLDSGTLSLASARKLGIVALERDDLER